MMLSTGIGAEVQRPLATVVVFGMVTDTFLTMLVLPSLYLLFGRKTLPLTEAAASMASAHAEAAGPGSKPSPEPSPA
jgi:cobalt-zinc-cadmium resistance protein CzcA